MEQRNYEKINIKRNQEFYLFSFKTRDINRIIPMHFHQEFEVLYCISGRMKIWVERQTILLKPGQFFVFNSLVPHSTQSYEMGEFIVIYFRPNLILDRVSRINILGHKENNAGYKRASQLIHRIYSSTKLDDPYVVFHQQSLLNEFIYILLKEFSTEKGPDQRLENRNKKINDIIYLVKKYYTSQLTLTRLADLSGYTPAYLSRMFKENIGQTFSNYKKSLCVEHAINMIENTDSALELIAQESGFANEKSLRLAFKEIMQLTPREYIRRIKR